MYKPPLNIINLFIKLIQFKIKRVEKRWEMECVQHQQGNQKLLKLEFKVQIYSMIKMREIRTYF